MSRVDIHLYFMIMAKAAALRGTCPRRKVGAVVVANNEQVSTGYNGSPKGAPHCIDEGIGCLLNDDKRCIRTIHGELNAILKAPRGVGDTLYCTDQPCLRCLQAALNHGITKIYYERRYPDYDRDTFVIVHQLNNLMEQMSLSNVILEVSENG